MLGIILQFLLSLLQQFFRLFRYQPLIRIELSKVFEGRNNTFSRGHQSDMSKRKTVDPSLEKRDEDMDMDGSDEVGRHSRNNNI